MALITEKKRAIMESMEMLISLISPEDLWKDFPSREDTVILQFKENDFSWEISKTTVDRLLIIITHGETVVYISAEKEWVPEDWDQVFEIHRTFPFFLEKMCALFPNLKQRLEKI